MLNSGLEVQPGQLSSKEDDYYVYSYLPFSVQDGLVSAFVAYDLSEMTIDLKLVADYGVVLAKTELLDNHDYSMLSFV